MTTGTSAWSQIHTDAEEAFRIAAETHRPVLLIFAGSDWCAPCIRFEKKILNEDKFQTFASENIVILRADFPQRHQLPKVLQEQNEKLAETYNPKGIFPDFILIKSDRTVLSRLTYGNQTPEEFISAIKHVLAL